MLDASFRPTTQFIAVKNADTTASAIRVINSEGVSIEADATQEGVSFTAKGKPPQNEEGAIVCCGLLAEHLRRHDSRVGPPRAPSGPEHGVDCEIETSAGLLAIQVTRPSGDLWRSLGTRGDASATTLGERLAEDLMNSARKKATHINPTGVVLALDVTSSAHYATGTVRNRLAARGADFAALGFDAVWLVGPVVALVVRLDDPNSQHS